MRAAPLALTFTTLYTVSACAALTAAIQATSAIAAVAFALLALNFTVATYFSLSAWVHPEATTAKNYLMLLATALIR